MKNIIPLLITAAAGIFLISKKNTPAPAPAPKPLKRIYTPTTATAAARTFAPTAAARTANQYTDNVVINTTIKAGQGKGGPDPVDASLVGGFGSIK